MVMANQPSMRVLCLKCAGKMRVDRLFSKQQLRRFSSQTSSSSSSASKSSSGLGVKLTAGALALIGGASLYARETPMQWILKNFSDPIFMPLARKLDGETAHRLAVYSAKYGLVPRDVHKDDPMLAVTLFGLNFPNPFGVAAGFDKHADAMEAMLDAGFGAVEIGSITPLPQPGNPKPRVFRLVEDRGIINRYGFNSEGIESVAKKLQEYVTTRAERTAAPDASHRRGVVGVNLGKNKTMEDAAADYVVGVFALGQYADYLVVNVSSPNTPGLRALQSKDQLKQLLQRVLYARDGVQAIEQRKIPLLLKVAPDLTEQDKKDIAEVALQLKLDGMIVSNTTISRPTTLISANKVETGGLSGAPVRDLSTQVLHDMYRLTKGKIPLIGVGGVSTGKDAYDKIRAGASLVQMYSCMVYDGPLAVARAKQQLCELLRADGYKQVSDAVGAAHRTTTK